MLMKIRLCFSAFICMLCLILLQPCIAQEKKQADQYLFNDSHFHLTNYIQEGISIQKMLELMDNKVARSTLFGIPLQQQWSYANSGDFAPDYYLETDAPLYYYSFTDASIAMEYRSLPKKQQDRLDPMITGFNPSDMYGVKHIERVLRTFPGVFTGIGEFSIHKEFVSSKVSGEVASLTNPALDSILAFSGEVGLLVILHNDVNFPMADEETKPVYLEQTLDLFKRHTGTTIIWAHVGLGRIVRPFRYGATPTGERLPSQVDVLEDILKDPTLSHIHFDLSWDEVAKYIVASEESLENTAKVINRYPDRFLFGTDVVAPPNEDRYLAVYHMYQKLWDVLTPEAKEKVTKGNYIRLFDAAREQVRAWEKANIIR
ncbi:MAG: putative metal-dependent hydrolase of the TIM-barrel fold [Algoriphagus marincola HL-49]|uniref:Putative metal-dependent hydrolase of the TIM-barrel fold n=1 Tax=Algoriphagus marincola HL-49 TaxID=1305737 RepID=A0A0P8AKH2_9BACT|nr:MAG: putative metal-dependent hydrolase of the TIM-barrel fold [Algoriphagus marincola HL-49]